MKRKKRPRIKPEASKTSVPPASPKASDEARKDLNEQLDWERKEQLRARWTGESGDQDLVSVVLTLINLIWSWLSLEKALRDEKRAAANDANEESAT